ncbi:hypothetical protein [Faecalicatena contorta]|uniref:hypothetical protein n=1 Tax=Faecalicatena contorta TaxID=39482 RepID=UPI001A9A6764|nr:hypothetical protein [Faecalicatena contorta]
MYIRQDISTVEQDVFLFDDTIREDIRHARPNATNEEIEDDCAFPDKIKPRFKLRLIKRFKSIS